MGRGRGLGRGPRGTGRDIFSKYDQKSASTQQGSTWQEQLQNQEKRQEERLSNSTAGKSYEGHEGWVARQAAKSIHEVTPTSQEEMNKIENLPDTVKDEAKAAARLIFDKYAPKENDLPKTPDKEHDKGEEP